MKAHAPSPAVETQQTVAARSTGARQATGEPAFFDNRPAGIVQRKLAHAITNSNHVLAQRQRLRGMFAGAAQFQSGVEEEEPTRSHADEGLQLKTEPEAVRNNTGLPDGAKVRDNSLQPAQLNALASTQGRDIHIASGQEQHLLHEAPVQTMPAKGPALRRGNFGRSIVQRVGGVKSGYNPETIAKVPFKAAVKELFDLARLLNKARKRIATEKNKTKLATLPEASKGAQVKGAYAEDLIAINLDPAWLSKVLTDAGAIDAILKDPLALPVLGDDPVARIKAQIVELKKKVSVKLDSQEILDQTWKKEDGGLQPTAKILTGDALYVLKTAKNVEGGVFRDVYKKLGKADGEHNEYVLDDYGKKTRRFAYMEKGYHQWMAFKEKGYLTGKTQNFIGDATGQDSSKVNPSDFDNQHLTKDEQQLIDDLVADDDTPQNRGIALAFIHQWKGSGPGQRGLSLASTEKENAVFGNAGEPFKTTGGAKFKIDLAKTNPADNALINHYTTESATRSKLTGVGGAASDRRLGGHYQYERSAIKNREIYLKHLRPEAVVSITPNTPGVDIERDSAIFNTQKQAAISSAQAAKSVDEWKAWKVKLQQDLDQAKATKLSAPKAIETAKQRKLYCEGERAKCNPRYLKATWRDGFGKKMTDYNYWDECAKSWVTEQEKLAASIVQANLAIAELPAKILACDVEIRAFTADIKAKPDGSNEHATKGWATGELYTQGYEAGLLKVKGKTFTKQQAITEIFQQAYEDGAKKGKAKKEGKAYTEKYDAYWEGYGKALQTALVK